MDLSWNFAAESQAYDRVHRLGQEKDVFVKRLVVEETIEERMLRLQDVKMGTSWSLSSANKDVNVLSRLGRCGARRGDRSEAS
jgi:SNF2 family DNA or RNA helicase